MFGSIGELVISELFNLTIFPRGADLKAYDSLVFGLNISDALTRGKLSISDSRAFDLNTSDSLVTKLNISDSLAFALNISDTLE